MAAVARREKRAILMTACSFLLNISWNNIGRYKGYVKLDLIVNCF